MLATGLIASAQDRTRKRALRTDDPELTAHTRDGRLIRLRKEKKAVYCTDSEGNRVRSPFGGWTDSITWIEGVRWDVALLAFRTSGELEKGDSREN